MSAFLRAGARPALLGLCLGLFLTGCGKPSEDAVVAGEVSLDGAPLKKGMIRFVPANTASRPVDGEVLDGKYEVRVPPGECRVEVTAPKVVGKRKMYDTADSPEVEDITELLPARFNTQSTLTITVAPGRQEKRFEVQEK